MTSDESATPSTTDVPPAPDAEVTPPDDQNTDSAGTDGPAELPATSPKLEHLQETISQAENAADEALAPQRDDA